MDPATARIIAHRYELDRLLGTGGMAEVWLARDRTTGEEVAVKLALSSAGREGSEAIAREASIGHQLHHANIVELLDNGEDGGQPFLVFEYVRGPSLRQMLQWRENLPETSVVDIGLGVSAALQHAHARGILHNDLKPENIILAPAGPKVVDFGTASSLTQTVGPERARELMGTIAYLAPEVLQGAPPSPQSDIYALGLTLYEAAAGRLPFPGSNPAAVAGQRLSQPAPPLRQLAAGISPRLESAVGVALSLNPARRFATGEQLARALKPAILPTNPTVALASRTGPTSSADAEKQPRPWPVLAALVALVGVLLVGGGLALALFRPDGADSSPEDTEALVQAPEPTATATPTEVPPTPTAVPTQEPTQPPATEKPSSGNSGTGNGNGNDDKDKKDKDKKDEKDDKPNRGRGRFNFLPEWEEPTPEEVRDAVSSLFQEWRRAFEDSLE